MNWLPAETVINILQYLGNEDLKRTRLVCYDRAKYSAEHLFRKLYVSPHDLKS